MRVFENDIEKFMITLHDQAVSIEFSVHTNANK
jgi:hypothetical protein